MGTIEPEESHGQTATLYEGVQARSPTLLEELGAAGHKGLLNICIMSPELRPYGQKYQIRGTLKDLQGSRQMW